MHPYPPIRDAAGEPGHRATASEADREGLRPLALPALAAAVHINARASAQAALADRLKAAARRVVHEDEPTV